MPSLPAITRSALKRAEGPALPGYWGAAVRKAWETFSLHTGVAGLLLPVVTGFAGYAVGARAETIGVWRGVLGGVAVAVAYYFLILLLITPRKLWNETQRKLIPWLDFYSSPHDSLLTGDERGETYRLVVVNNSVKTIDNVWVRVISGPTESHLNGAFPIWLREQHSEVGGPFVLNGGGAKLLIDLFQYSATLSTQIARDGQQRILFCYDPARPTYAGIMHSGSHEIEIEAQGRDVTPQRKKFCVRSLLPERLPNGASLDIAEISEFTNGLTASDTGSVTRPAEPSAQGAAPDEWSVHFYGAIADVAVLGKSLERYAVALDVEITNRSAARISLTARLFVQWAHEQFFPSAPARQASVPQWDDVLRAFNIRYQPHMIFPMNLDRGHTVGHIVFDIDDVGLGVRYAGGLNLGGLNEDDESERERHSYIEFTDRITGQTKITPVNFVYAPQLDGLSKKSDIAVRGNAASWTLR